METLLGKPQYFLCVCVIIEINKAVLLESLGCLSSADGSTVEGWGFSTRDRELEHN